MSIRVNALIDLLQPYGSDHGSDGSPPSVVISEWKDLVDEHNVRFDSPVIMILFDRNANELCFLSQSELPVGPELPDGMEIIWRSEK